MRIANLVQILVDTMAIHGNVHVWMGPPDDERPVEQVHICNGGDRDGFYAKVMPRHREEPPK